MNIIANIPQVTRASAIDARHTGSIWQDGKYRTLGSIGHGTQALSRAQLMQCAPSIFADAATLARWEDIQAAPIRADKLLTIKRTEDAAPTLWNTFNTVQENIIKGGQKDYSKRKANGERMPRVRPVKGIDGNLSLNKALWHLAEQMKALKANA